jgi:hypothetical protein
LHDAMTTLHRRIQHQSSLHQRWGWLLCQGMC